MTHQDDDDDEVLKRRKQQKHLIPFSPTNGRDQVKTSMKLGSQYGCGEQLNCRMFMTLFSYFSTAAVGVETK